MQRQFQFRAWNESKKQMTYLESQYVSEALHYHEQGSHVLMQACGLKDKNGKEIYEGDVVRYIQPSLSQNAKKDFVVEYEDYNCRFVLTDSISITYGFDRLELVCIDNLHQPDIQIIGNIYENPEL